MRRLRTVAGIRDAYSRRILSNIIGRDALRVLAATPGELRRLTRGLSRREIAKGGAGGAWSMGFLLSHLCDAEWVSGFRIRMALTDQGRQFQAYDQDVWADRLAYDRADWKEKLALFTALRRSHIALLRGLTPRQWGRYGMHEERGRETVERITQLLAGHDINHLRQLRARRASLRKRA